MVLAQSHDRYYEPFHGQWTHPSIPTFNTHNRHNHIYSLTNNHTLMLGKGVDHIWARFNGTRWIQEEKMMIRKCIKFLDMSDKPHKSNFRITTGNNRNKYCIRYTQDERKGRKMDQWKINKRRLMIIHDDGYSSYKEE